MVCIDDIFVCSLPLRSAAESSFVISRLSFAYCHADDEGRWPRMPRPPGDEGEGDAAHAVAMGNLVDVGLGVRSENKSKGTEDNPQKREKGDVALLNVLVLEKKARVHTKMICKFFDVCFAEFALARNYFRAERSFAKQPSEVGSIHLAFIHQMFKDFKRGNILNRMVVLVVGVD
jgi:hypothetical protein